MEQPPPAPDTKKSGRLERCIRDLAALNVLPNLCIAKTPAESLDIIFNALPTALDCALIYVMLPGSPPAYRAVFEGKPLDPEQLATFRAAMSTAADGVDGQVFLDGRRLWCLEAEIPLGEARGHLLAGRATELDPETDRLLVRTAANVVGTILATARVLESARRKDDFLAVLGHELRNPLAPIATAAELLRRRPEVTRERTIIERHTRHLVRLVDDLLDISRATRGEVQLRKEHVSLAAVLQHAGEIAARLVARGRHELRLPSEAADVILLGDPVRLAQVFGNLLTNAAKFTPPGGTIEVSLARAPGRVRVTVRDSGCGIAADQLERIFEPFVQADRERDALRGGLGLGLAIVKNLVQGHGGTITVSSGGRGQGAAFTVDLPAAVAAEPARDPTPRGHAGVRQGVRVLVVDDNVDIAELLSEALKEVGFETATAHDGHQALTQWHSFLPHAGVLDVGLPDLDGYEVARQLRARYGDSATLIAATGYGEASDRARATDAGFDCYLVKPVALNDLIVILDERVAASNAGATSPSPQTDPPS